MLLFFIVIIVLFCGYRSLSRQCLFVSKYRSHSYFAQIYLRNWAWYNWGCSKGLSIRTPNLWLEVFILMVEVLLTFYKEYAKLPSFLTFSIVLGIVLTPKLEIWLVSPSLKLIKNKSNWTYIHFKYFFFLAYHTIQFQFYSITE